MEGRIVLEVKRRDCILMWELIGVRFLVFIKVIIGVLFIKRVE